MKSNKSFYLGFLTLNIVTILQADNLHWEKSLHTIIDTPMLLRTPQALEYQVYEKKFSYFATILHTIKEVNKDGQLDAKIEKSLEEFDQYIVEYLPDRHLGVTVLVETFAGRRAYYVYADSALSITKFKTHLLKDFPDKNLMISKPKLDKKWKIIKDYARDFGF